MATAVPEKKTGDQPSLDPIATPTATQDAVSASWVAVIYKSDIQKSDYEQTLIMAGVQGLTVTPPWILGFGYFDETQPSRNLAAPYATLSVQVGTNLGHHTKDNGLDRVVPYSSYAWAEIRKQAIPAALIQKGVIELIPPVGEIEEGLEPGYRHFSVADALRLIDSHLHSVWIDKALIGEQRSAVILAAEKRKGLLIQLDKKRSQVV